MLVDLIGKYIITRGYNSGVHAGEVVSIADGYIRLINSRRLWTYVCRRGKWLSGVAAHGVAESSRLGVPVDIYIQMTDVCEIILVTEEARKSIEEIKGEEV